MSGVYFLKFLKVIFLLSPFEKLHHSLFYLSILFFNILLQHHVSNAFMTRSSQLQVAVYCKQLKHMVGVFSALPWKEHFHEVGNGPYRQHAL
jgi:hypothetical protein